MPLKTILKNIGGTIKTVTEFVEEEVIDPISNQIEYGVDEFRQGNPAPVLNAMSLGMSGAMAPLTQAVRGVDETEGTLLESAGNYVEDKTGIPSLVTQVAAGVLIPGPGEYKAAGKSIARGVKKAFPLEGVDNIFPPTPPTALATAGAAPRVQLNVSGGKANLAPEVMEITIKDPDNLARGAAEGWAKGSEFGEEMTKWRNRRMELREQMRNPSGLTADRRRKNKTKSLITAYNDVSTGPTRLVDNPVAYDKTPFKKISDLEKRNMEQHHLFPKQESYQFVERMIELGDEDDVLNLMIFAEEVDASMGGRLVNMLNMERQPHTILHNSRKAIEDGRQLKSLEMKNLVENAKSSDELMELFKTYIETNIRPSKDEAFALNNLYEIAKKQGKHEEMYKALKNKGR